MIERRANRGIEIHDSVLDRLHLANGTAELYFSHLYIHESEGRPGIDPGTGWSQEGKLTIRGALVEGSFSEWPADLHSGSIMIGDELFENDIPIALDTQAEVRLLLQSWSDVISIRGKGATLELIGKATYVEDFKPS